MEIINNNVSESQEKSKKTALIIGGGGGIGSEITRSMVKKGIKVYATYHDTSPEPKLEDIKGSLLNLCKMNLIDSESVKDSIKKILRDNKIDIVVFSATLPIENKPIMKMEWQDIEKHIDIQVKGLFNVFECLKEQIANKYKTKFIIILTEYVVGKPPASLSHYITSKYSLFGFAKCMAVELAKYNCTINMISPGMVKTDLISNLPHKLIELTEQNNPLKRIAIPKDISNLVLFLSSDESDYLNGANIIINGGGIML